jgi:hypothetical protein
MIDLHRVMKFSQREGPWRETLLVLGAAVCVAS